MGSEETDTVAQEIMATLDTLFLAEKRARLQVSALEDRQYALATTFRMVQEIDDDAELWISEEYGLMVFLSFTAPDGRYYHYRIVSFDVIGGDGEEAG